MPPQIADPSASKPENWLDDEEDMIPGESSIASDCIIQITIILLTVFVSDTTAVKPGDWDVEMDGVWEAPLVKNSLCEDNGCGKWEPPMIANPEYKGKWRAPLLDNPNYQGKWAPRRIQNPDYFEDNDPFQRLTAIVSEPVSIYEATLMHRWYFLVCCWDWIVVNERRHSFR